MKYLVLLLLAFSCTACSFFYPKSEEAVIITVDTASILKGRTVDARVLIKNSDKAEVIKK